MKCKVYDGWRNMHLECINTGETKDNISGELFKLVKGQYYWVVQHTKKENHITIALPDKGRAISINKKTFLNFFSEKEFIINLISEQNVKQI